MRILKLFLKIDNLSVNSKSFVSQNKGYAGFIFDDITRLYLKIVFHYL